MDWCFFVCLFVVGFFWGGVVLVYLGFFFFLLLFFTTVLPQLDFFHGKFGLPSPGKPAATVALPYIRCMLGVLVFP